MLRTESLAREATLAAMKRIGFVGVAALALVEMTGQSAFCELVGLAIDAGGRTPPLAYSLDVLERYDTEHC
jgi:hypothetical protein